ncbi:MAG TPA: DUF1080 domain-containing protein [Cyclobacteriaceae bacterium]|nr:DUF1080 domain-containing protein [Cyclobacteriaceae bacterium]
MKLFAGVLFVAVILCNCGPSKPLWTVLFNGSDLNGWDTYLGPVRNDSMKITDSIPLGLNQDPRHVFSVVNEDGQPAIRISGAHHGGISTLEEFSNFHLVLEFKWGTAKIPSFKNRKRDSGLLYFAVGPHGADYGNWMRSQEFQIQEGDCGDYWGVAGGVFDVPVTPDSAGRYFYDKKGTMTTFSAVSKAGRRCFKNPDAERPTGEWNTIELYCKGDTSIHVVNGVVNMVLYHSRQTDHGTETPLKKGKLQLQSEGCEVFYRNIKIESLHDFPTDLFPADLSDVALPKSDHADSR